jgi:hypothetical protein
MVVVNLVGRLMVVDYPVDLPMGVDYPVDPLLPLPEMAVVNPVDFPMALTI